MILAIMWTVLIFTVSSIPSNELQKVEEKTWIGTLRKVLLDPVMHFIEFAVLAFFLVNAFANAGEMDRIRVLKRVLFIGISIAVIDEVHQCFIPLRNFQFGDIVMDSLGVSLASVGWLVCEKKKNCCSDERRSG